MRAPELREAIPRLPWLAPSAASLVALAHEPAGVWDAVRADPGAVLLLLRAAGRSDAVPILPNLVHDPAVLEAAHGLLETPRPGFVDWSAAGLRPIYQAALSYAFAAYAVARRTGRCDPDAAWAGGLLSVLGWFAVAATDADAAAACVSECSTSEHASRAQQTAWGLDQAAIARRLCRRWQVPRWVTAVAGYLDLPPETAQVLGAEVEIFRIVQVAVGLVQQQRGGPYLIRAAPSADLVRFFGFSANDIEEIAGLASANNVSSEPAWQSPLGVPLLRELLAAAAEKRRITSSPVLAELESDVDQLHQALRCQYAGEEGRLRALKLGALAELAAGAGHEINNPLAVISGQAQYLLHHEQDPTRRRALEAVIGQARRIHLILSDLMQFARPAQPRKEWLDAAAVAEDAVGTLRETAAERQVALICVQPSPTIRLHADPGQVATAIRCLLQNALEAAAPGGWVQVRIETPTAEAVAWVVEDSGPGPAPHQRDHLFDPFFSGRQAGRGRGLGLSTAWRLAHEHQGDVRFEPLPAGPTRFVLTLPRQSLDEPGLPIAASAPHTQSGVNGHAGDVNGDVPDLGIKSASPEIPAA